MKLSGDDDVKSSSSGHCRVLAFEMQIGGHHPSYIRNFSEQWAVAIPQAEIDYVVSREFFQRHGEVVEAIQRLDPQRIRIHQLTVDENYQVRLESRSREFAGWRIFCRYAESLAVNKALLMYSDHFQLPMLLGHRPPCPVSCIYFRPTFHYKDFHGFRPTWPQRLAAWRKRWMLSRLLRLESLDTLFCLDHLAAAYISQNFKTHAHIRALPDSFKRSPIPEGRLEMLRHELGIEGGRRILLLLGILDSRKGPIQLLQAATGMSLPAQQRLCLLLLGKVNDALLPEVSAKVDELNSNTPMQVILRDRYIDDTVVQQYYEISDVALTTYQRHMGMSSALIRAAMARIPVLSSDYGLMGELVRQHHLGVAVDTTDPSCFTQGLEQVLIQDLDSLHDEALGLEFAKSHSPEALAATLKEWVQR